MLITGCVRLTFAERTRARETREGTRVSPSRARVFSCAHLFPSACYTGYVCFVSTRIRDSVNSNGTKLEQVVHTHRTSCRGSRPRGRWTKSQSSILNIYFRLRGFQSLFPLLHFRYGPNTCSQYTKVWHRTYPICDAPLSRRNHCSYVWTEDLSKMVFAPV